MEIDTDIRQFKVSELIGTRFPLIFYINCREKVMVPRFVTTQRQENGLITASTWFWTKTFIPTTPCSQGCWNPCIGVTGINITSPRLFTWHLHSRAVTWNSIEFDSPVTPKFIGLVLQESTRPWVTCCFSVWYFSIEAPPTTSLAQSEGTKHTASIYIYDKWLTNNALKEQVGRTVSLLSLTINFTMNLAMLISIEKMAI